MIDFLNSFGFSPVQWLLVFGAAALIGANKTGLLSIQLISIPLLAAVFGGRASTGVMVPMLILADIIAVFSYRKSIQWRALLGLFPWALAGIVTAILIGNYVNDSVFKKIIAGAVFVVLIFMIIKEVTGREIKVEGHWYTNAVIGLLGGFATMIGNAAGPIIAVYFLSINLNKNEFISTRAWFFWLVNLAKVPFHLFVWKTISLQSFYFDLLMIPGLIVGGLLGFFLVKYIPEKPYRIFVIIATFVSVIFLIV